MRVTVDLVDVQPNGPKVSLAVEEDMVQISPNAARIIAQALIAAAEEVEDA